MGQTGRQWFNVVFFLLPLNIVVALFCISAREHGPARGRLEDDDSMSSFPDSPKNIVFVLYFSTGTRPCTRPPGRRWFNVVVFLLPLNIVFALQHGNTALHEAAWKGYSQTVGVLVRARGNFYIKNRGGFAPLHLCCQNGHNETCRVILLAGCKPDIKNNVSGFCVTFKAIVYQLRQCVKSFFWEKRQVNSTRQLYENFP